MPLQPDQEILFTRQRHEADRMGLHWDYRLVAGDKAYSWATKKELPEPGRSIILFEQPVHDRHYALSKKVVIPKGSYGAGVTTLDWVRKARIGENSTSDQLTIHTKDGQKFLLKKLKGSEWGDKAWLFRNLGKTGNKYIEKAANLKLPASCPCNRYLVKIAEALGKHQEEALSKLEKSKGIVLHHSTGSGKTKTFLTAAERAQKENPQGHVLIVAPASLQTNVDKEIEKHKLNIDRNRLTVLSYEKATNMADELAKRKYALAVADEAHKLRNIDAKRTRKLRDIISSSDKRILATATGNYNRLSDISPLVNMAAGKAVLPEDPAEMENRYIKTIRKKPTLMQRVLGKKPDEAKVLNQEKELGKIFGKYVSYYDAKDDPKMAGKFPKQTEEVVEVPMSPEQHRLYRYVEGDLPWLLRMKVRHNLPLDKKERASLNAFSTGVRQVSNSMRHLSSNPDEVPHTPKIEKAVARLKERLSSDKNFRGLVYSNYLDSGVHEYAKRLEKEGIPHRVYSGGLTRKEKDQIVADYNSGKVPVLLVSSSGAEGLDLKGTKLIQTLEPHFNKAKIKQVIGRGARFGSHEHLPEKERHVHVEHYQSVLPPSRFSKTPYSIDKYLTEHSDDKDELFNQVRKLMKKHAA